MSGGYVWPVITAGPVASQLAEIAAGLRFAHRNPDILNLERLAVEIDRVCAIAQRQEQALDAIVGEAAARERATAGIDRARRPVRELAR